MSRHLRFEEVEDFQHPGEPGVDQDLGDTDEVALQCPAVVNVSWFLCPTSIYPFSGTHGGNFLWRIGISLTLCPMSCRWPCYWLQVAQAWPVRALHFPGRRFGSRVDPVKANGTQWDIVETTERAFLLNWSFCLKRSLKMKSVWRSTEPRNGESAGPNLNSGHTWIYP